MLSHLHSLIAERNSPEQTDVLQRFADLYFSGAPQELQQRDVADLYGATLSCWQFVQQAGQAIKVRYLTRIMKIMAGSHYTAWWKFSVMMRRFWLIPCACC